MKKKLKFLSNRTCIRIPNKVHHIHELPLLLFLVLFRVLRHHHFNVLGPSFLVQQLEDISKRKKTIYTVEKIRVLQKNRKYIVIHSKSSTIQRNTA